MITEVVEAYGKAAARAVASGFDTMELHLAHNYLPHSFLSGGINRRTDEYGGSFENRCRFPLEVIRAVRANIPEDMPLFMRIAMIFSTKVLILFCQNARKYEIFKNEIAKV